MTLPACLVAVGIKAFVSIAAAGAAGRAPPPASRALLVRPGDSGGEASGVSQQPSRPHQVPWPSALPVLAVLPEVAPCTVTGVAVGGSWQVPAGPLVLTGVQETDIHTAWAIVTCGLSRAAQDAGQRSRHLSLLVPTSSRLSRTPVFNRSPCPDHPATPPDPTWPAGAGKRLPEISAVSVGWAGSRSTGTGHDTAWFHVHSVAGGKQGR